MRCARRENRGCRGTSLPEVSTVISAVRLHRYVMAASDIVGTHLFNIGLVFAVDAASRGGAAVLHTMR